MCGGVCGPRDRHRDLFADRHLPADDAGGIVRGVADFHCCPTTAKFFNFSGSQEVDRIEAGKGAPFPNNIKISNSGHCIHAG
jgi:hypothetical protein